MGLMLLFGLGVGCDWTVESSDTTDSLQTRILSVDVQPDPLAPGDTATFTAVLADSTDPSFEFRWYLAGISPVIITDSAHVSWPTPNQTGTFTHVVTADNGNDTLRAPTVEFDVTIDAQE